MKIDYTADQLEYAEQMEYVKQGVIIYNHPGASTGDEWNPTIGASTPYTLDGYAKGVSQKYIDGSFIVATDLEITSSVFAVTPTLAGTMTIDGKEVQIIKAWQVPAAGTPVAYKMIVRA